MGVMKQSAPKAKKAKKNPAAKTGQKGFPKGTSGNPAGRPPGSRNKRTLLVESMLDDEAEEVIRAILDAAKNGEPWAATWVGNRLLPVRRSQPVAFDMPPMESVKDLPAAHDALLAAVARGEIDLDEAVKYSGLLDARRKAIEMADLVDEMEAFKVYLKVKR